MKKIIFLWIALLFAIPDFGQKKILFDNTKSEEAGNADWIIDNNEPTPSPDQSGITSSTSETYWTGGLSAWGVEMVKRGYFVETLPSNGQITYGDNSNSQDLSNYDVFVICEPNNRFSATEKQAILDFVQNGGGLFIISDHDNSDRDNDGWDSPHIWNDFFADYNNPFGITFDYVSITDAPTTNIISDATDPILHGVAGDVTSMEFHGSATMTIDKSKNSSVKAVVYKSGADNSGNTQVMLAYGTYGNGRFVALVDSSPADDGTGQSGNTLYDGWNQYDNQTTNGKAITNATIWLAKDSGISQNCDNCPNIILY